MDRLPDDAGAGPLALAVLSRFRRDFHASLTARADELAEPTAVLDAIRLGPGDDEAGVTAAQVREVITRLVTAGHWQQGTCPSW